MRCPTGRSRRLSRSRGQSRRGRPTARRAAALGSPAGICWYCSVSVASMTAAFAPDWDSTSLVRMSTRCCNVATKFFWVAIVFKSISRSAVFCVRCASNEASVAESCPRSAASTRSSRSRNAGAVSGGQSIAGSGEKACAFAAASAACRRSVSARAEASASLAAAKSASAAERSSSMRTSPFATELPLTARMAATRPVSRGSITLTRPVG